MKKFAKIFVFTLTIAVLVGLFCFSTSAESGTPGQVVTVSFAFPNCYGADGSITCNNKNLFDAFTVSSPNGGDVQPDSFYIFGVTKGQYEVKVSVKLKADAAIGSTSTITLKYETATDNNGNMSSWQYASKTITVVKGSTYDDTKSDLSELKLQIQIASALQQPGYTDASWQKLCEALTVAQSVDSNAKQSVINTLTQRLKDAIAGLEKIDYTALRAALAEAETLLNSTKENRTWKEFINSLENANEKLSSGKQSDVNNAAKALVAAIEALKAEMGSAETVIVKETVIVVETTMIEGPVETTIVEVPYEVTTIVKETVISNEHPTWCVWKILFFILLIIFIVAVAYIIVDLLQKKKNRKDTTPLVDYKIEDDDHEV